MTGRKDDDKVGKNREVVITGVGFVSNHSRTKDELWEKFEVSFQKPEPIKRFSTAQFKSHTGYDLSDGFDIKRYTTNSKVTRKEFFSKLAVAAAVETLRDAGINLREIDPAMFGSIITTVHGPIDATFKYLSDLEKLGPQNVSPNLFQQTVLNVAGGQVSILMNLKGVSSTLVGCSSISYAYHLIEAGRADLILAGGVEEIHPHIYSSYDQLGLLSVDQGEGEFSKPLSGQANGVVLGDGAGFVLLESMEHAAKRGAKIYAKICDYVTRVDPHFCKVFNEFVPEESSFFDVLQHILQRNNLDPLAVDLISLAANSYPKIDQAELNGIKRLFADRPGKVSCVASKAIFGETLGNSEIYALIPVLLCFEKKNAPGLKYLSDHEVEEALVVAREAKTDLNYALVNSFFVGGNVNCLLVKNMC